MDQVRDLPEVVFCPFHVGISFRVMWHYVFDLPFDHGMVQVSWL